MPAHFNRESSLELIHLIDELPSLPRLYSDIQAVIHDVHSDASDLAAVISTDQATSAMVLRCANSACHNPGNIPIVDLAKAVSRIGFTDTANIAAAMSLLYGFALPMGIYHIRAFWCHVYAVGIFCKALAPHFNLDKEELFTLGLLHDCGRIILGLRVDMGYFESELALLNGLELAQAEREKYGLDHCEAGAELLKLWGFPEMIQQAVLEYLDDTTDFLPAKIVAIANREARARIASSVDIDEIEGKYLPAFTEDIAEVIKNSGLQ